MYHCHSDYSLLDSCTKYEDYIDLAVKEGARGLSISEHGKPLNWTEKWAKCTAAGLRYMHSVEIYLTETHEEKVRDNYHTVLIARNMDGLRELNAAISRSCDKDHFYYTNRLSFEEFLNLSDNIIATSACLASPLWRLPRSHPMYAALVKRYNFLEVQAHSHPDQVEFNKLLVELAHQYDKPLIAGTDTHSSTPYKAECRSVLLSAKGKSYGDEDAFDLTYKTRTELEEMFKTQGVLTDAQIEGAIENTNALMDMTEDIVVDTSFKFPISYGSREADTEKFRETVDTMFKEKVESGIIPPEQVPGFEAAIKEEMEVFENLGMSAFMLSMSELMHWCKENKFSVGFGRGSVGGSRVAYITDITDINPEQWGTIFSRFMNPDRIELPDIDTDVCEKDRPAIFKHIIEKFGVELTARVASFGTLQEKGVIDDVGRHLAKKWKNEHGDSANNPWSLSNIASIKREYDDNPDATKEKYPELFYYMDGLFDTKISQSVHPAGIIISPITLRDNYGVFDKDGEGCIMIDMDACHDVGLVKYDMLLLKTVKVLRDICDYLGTDVPKSHEINWNDEAVWDNIASSPVGLFQYESPFAFGCVRGFKPRNIDELALVAAFIRPSAASFRDDIIARKVHKNPSEMIDKLLSKSLGYLSFQEDVIAFLKDICGMTGGEADTTRRLIAKKKKDEIEKLLPRILDGYCKKSDKPRDVAEKEAQEFLQVIDDSSAYMFNRSHAVAYSMLTYICAYYRCYHPLEFITSFLNNAANDDDVINGTEYAARLGVHITMPKWGVSRAEYSYDLEKKQISKGLASVKYISKTLPDELYNIAHSRKYDRFVDVLLALKETSIDSRQLAILSQIDFFSEFGNQREILRITDMFTNIFKEGEAKKVQKEKVAGTPLEDIVAKYSVGTTKSGGDAKSYTIVDMKSILKEAEDAIKVVGMTDIDVKVKIQNFVDALGYMGYVTYKDEDRPSLYVMDVHELRRKSDNKQFGYSIITKSIGSGKESRFSIMNRYLCDGKPPREGDIIRCLQWHRNGKYLEMTGYKTLY
jgi:DNA polymerase-3 subunit alpha